MSVLPILATCRKSQDCLLDRSIDRAINQSIVKQGYFWLFRIISSSMALSSMDSDLCRSGTLGKQHMPELLSQRELAELLLLRGDNVGRLLDLLLAALSQTISHDGFFRQRSAM
jgi:hypothetical protein